MTYGRTSSCLGDARETGKRKEGKVKEKEEKERKEGEEKESRNQWKDVVGGLTVRCCLRNDVVGGNGFFLTRGRNVRDSLQDGQLVKVERYLDAMTG